MTLPPRPRNEAGDKLAQAKALHEQGALPEARRLYLDVLAEAPGHAEALFHLASLARQVGRPDVSARRLQEALAQHPNFLEAHLLLGNVLIDLGRRSEAEQAYRRALELDPDHGGARLNLGNLLRELGRLEAAEAELRLALEQAPELAEAENSLALLLQGLGRSEEALTHYRAALRKRPDYAGAHINLGTLYRELGRLDQAIEHYEAALRIDDSNEARTNLAALLERANRLDEAQVVAEAALKAHPEDPNARLTLAKLRQRRGDREGAQAAYLGLLEDLGTSQGESQLRTAARAHGDLGKLEEESGEYAAAFSHYAKANLYNGRSAPGWEADTASYLDWVRGLQTQVERKADKREVEASTGSAADAAPIFLVGFPRSGTTLLVQSLAALPGVALMDEKTALDEARFAHLGEGGPRALKALSAEGRGRLRKTYWDAAERYLGSGLKGQQLIDKMPLNLLNLWLIEAVFPDAKVLISLRDPRDVCLSCFATLFRLRAGTANFPTPEHTTELYAAVMDLWLVQRERLNLDMASTRYEDLIQDFEGELRRVVDFLGLPWDEAALDPAASARERFIVSPSYDQVVQPLYDSSIGRWRHFRAHLEPHLETLKPYLTAFGYDPD